MSAIRLATPTGVDLHRHMANGVGPCLGQRSGWLLPLGWTMDMGGGWLIECCLTSAETVGLLGTGAQDGHLDFHTVSEF